MIKFEDFFKVDNPNDYKVKFNMNNGNSLEPAWDYLRDDAPEWIGMNSWKTKQPNNNLNHCKYVFAFAQYYPYGRNYFIFGGLYKVEKKMPEVFNDHGYTLTLMDDFKEYRKRLIIKLEKPIGRDVYNVRYQRVQEKYNGEIYEISPSTKLGNFPGYNNVLLTHKDLSLIVKGDEPEWRNALSSVKAVYCITDTSTGKLYIGSATGDGAGLWERWSSYADVNDTTGGNKTFEELKKSDSNYIISNFTYSILEIFDMKTKREDIIKREEFWKRVFKSVKFGMNN